MRGKLPFALSREQTFYEALNDWIGDVFYDILPEKGFDLRDEQIFMAFQLTNSYKNKKVMFAEAGVGTGKTFVYLLYALAYARYTGKPAVIACADETLIEQLVKKGGDIEKLEHALGLSIDVRLAKSRDQYLCLQKLDAEISSDEKYFDVHQSLPDFVESPQSLKKYHSYGDRKEYSHLTDSEWEKIGWDSLQDCFSCSKRHRCGQTLSRDHYRHSEDLIVCSHDFYMEHIWTKESRTREGQLPLLPEASSVIFDEGHLLEFAAQKALTYRIQKNSLEILLERFSHSEMREKTLTLMEDVLRQNDIWFQELGNSAETKNESYRKNVHKSERSTKLGKKLVSLIEKLTEELVFEAELYVVDEYQLKIVEEYLEQMLFSLKLFNEDQKGIQWLETTGDGTLVIMPRLVEDILKSQVFNQNVPFIFSSATLSTKGEFQYLSNSLGIESFDSFSVESPFDYEQKMKISIPTLTDHEKYEHTYQQLMNMNGKSLILFSSKKSMDSFRNQMIDKKPPFNLYFEGDEEISVTVEKFQNDVQSVLCSYHLWEGLDIPGDSLSQVIIFDLPFPPSDPVFDAKRRHSADPFQEVDLPYMLLRLRQGIGRLIRTHEDQGTVHLLVNQDESQLLSSIEEILPVKAQ
ncbi:ATP-dependent DNA helicase DinG [Bacillus pakistanensis]|uniref:ATP-dependent DNA helicase DinG n=1 Tax=Rossellomorea pakistanensis TaxID=992288 RepID=A0ABS2N8W3_9BACI|nr:ATP-dependent DNA helicase [Bacillus pakistanensis]MBM7584292.1 ATP-dependent DNA helicase DinG [Bacillus pakistanensis]